MITKMKIERIKRGLSQQKLSEIAKVALGDISKIEHCRLIPYPTQAKKLSAVLGLAESELQAPVEVGAR